MLDPQEGQALLEVAEQELTNAQRADSLQMLIPKVRTRNPHALPFPFK